METIIKLRIPAIALSLLTMSTLANAQSIAPQIINAAGGSTSISGSTHEWSAGEMTVVHTAIAGGNVYTQGLLQPLIVTEVGISDPELKDNQLIVYPNPAGMQIFLQPDFLPDTDISITLSDISGRIISRQNATTLATGKEKQAINLSMLAAGSYILHIEISESGKHYGKTVKIQKQ